MCKIKINKCVNYKFLIKIIKLILQLKIINRNGLNFEK